MPIYSYHGANPDSELSTREISNIEDALEIAKLINLQNLILQSTAIQNLMVNEPDNLFYKGTFVLSQSITIHKKLLQKIENNQFNYNFILDKGTILKINTMSLYFNILTGLFVGFFLSFIIIFFKATFRNN